METEARIERIIQKARDAQNGGWGAQSTGEKLISAIVLNRPEWLDTMNYTIAEAIDHIGPQWLALIPKAARALQDEQ